MKSKKILITGMISALLLGGVGGGYYYINAAKLGYLKAESKGLQNVLTPLTSDQSDLRKSFEMFNSPVTSKQEISLGLESKQMDQQTQIIAQILKNSKVEVESFQDAQNSQSYVKATIAPVGAKPVVIESFSDKDKSGYGIPAFFNKYLYVNAADEEKVNKELGQTIPYGNINPNDLISALTVNKTEIETIGKEYAKIYADSINRKQVEAKSTNDGKEYIVSFDDKQGEQFIQKVSAKLKEDDKLVDLIFTHYDKATTVYKDAGVTIKNPQTKETIKKEIVEIADNMVKDMDKNDNSLRMLVIVNKNGDIVQRNISSNNNPEDTDFLKIFNNSTADSTDIRVIYENNDKATSVNEKVDFNYSLKPEGDSKKGAFSVVSTSNDKAKPQNSEIAVNFTLTKKDKAEKLDSRIVVWSKENGVLQTLMGTFAYNTEKTSDKTSTFDYTLKADLNTEKMPDLNLVLSGKGNYEIGKTMTLPIVNEGNAVNLANTSKVEMEKINEQMSQGFTNYILGNPALMQMVLAGMMS